MPREFVVTVDLGEGQGVRYIGEGMAILRAKADAMTYDLDTAIKKVGQYTVAFPDKAFGMERAADDLETFKKENSGLI
jgi:hypothetical protein